MKRALSSEEERRARASGWHRWFAWHPVIVPGVTPNDPDHRVWLEHVERKGSVVYDGVVYDYRFPVAK